MVFRKGFLYGILLAHLVFITSFWWNGNRAFFEEGTTASVWVSVGRILGLLLVTAVLHQLVLISRIPLIERTFGHDKLSRVHHWTGYGITGLLVGHVLSILIGYGMASDRGIVVEFLAMLSFPDVLQAVAAFALLLAVLALSVVIVVTKMKYEWWYIPHLATYVAVLFAYGHQLELGADLQHALFSAYWTLMYAIVAVLVGWNRFLKPVLRYINQRFVVDELHPENDSVLSVYIKGKHLDALRVHAGQFFIFRFFAKGLWWQAHPFSLSYAPHGDRIRISAKAVGDFTTSLRTSLKPGIPVLIEGPFGIFGRQAAEDPKVLLIAGGIGITPIRSVFETLVRKDAVLLYAAKTQQDLVLKNELDEIAKKNGTRVTYILSDEKGEWQGERGVLDMQKIQELVPDAAERSWYVCGPVPMMKGLRRVAMDMGIPDDQYHWERFKL